MDEEKKTDQIQMIQLSDLVPFKIHPFKVVDDESMLRTTESIATFGVLSPLIVRPIEDGKYEIISGHRRAHAAESVGLTEVPVIVKDMDDDLAKILVVDSNLQRESLLPSEKAFAYKMKMDALKRQGKRTDLTSDRLGPKLTATEISENDSATQVKRYIRLTYLIKPLLDLVDEGRIALGPAVELSYLPEETQRAVYDYYAENEVTPSYSQANQMKKHAAAGTLTPDALTQILEQPKPNQVETIKLPLEDIRKYKPKATVSQLQDFIRKACEHYAKYLRNRDRGAR